MRNSFVNTIIDACSARDDIFIISGDAGLGVFDDFKEKYPDKFLNLGVAEQNMTGFAAGLATTGFKVLLYNIIPFLLYRCYEQVRNDICYQKLPVIMAGIGSGVTYAPQGMTHYSVEDLGIAQTLPNLTVISPIDPVEARQAARYSLESDTPVYVRLAKRGEADIHQNDNFDISLPQVLKDGQDVALLFHGSISVEVIDAYKKLTKEEIYPRLVSVPMVKPLNIKKLLETLKDIDCVITVEEHFENTGLGNMLKTIRSDFNAPWQLTTLAIPFEFIHEIKDTANIRKFYGISSQDIIRSVKAAIEAKHGKIIKYNNAVA